MTDFDEAKWHIEYDRRIRGMSAKFGPEWQVREFQQMSTRDGVAFSGKVFYKGVFVGMVEQDGHGGPDTFFRVTNRRDGGGDPVVEEAFAAWEAISGGAIHSLEEEDAVAALLDAKGL